mgnify:CR=1 FL=1
MSKDVTLGKRLWILAVLIGLAFLFCVGAVSFSYFHKQVSERSEDILEYVKKQSLVFDSYNDASVMKSQYRIMQSAEQLARDLDTQHPKGDRKSLEQRCVELGITCIFVMDEEGNLQGSYSKDELGFVDVSKALTEESALDTACHPDKVYAVRVELEDGSHVDLACAARTDAPGLVAVGYHTWAEFSGRYMLTLQSMLDGYEAENDCSIVIERAGKVVASNTVEDGEVDNVTIAEADSAVVNGIKEHRDPGEMRLIRANRSFYYGTYGQARNYYVYTFVPGSVIYKKMWLVVGVAAMVYILLIGFYIYARRRSAHKHYEEMIEQERQYAIQLEASARDARSANNAKTEFLRRMSHDIRTPINGIRGMVEVANAHPDDAAKQAECREKIWMASGILLDLVNEVLDISKLESGELVLDITPTDIERQIDDVCEMLERQAQVRDITIVRIPYDIEHRYINVSAIHLKRLVMNIASNAVKYNKPGGTVRVSCRETTFEDGAATYEIEIADTGIGMSEEFQKHVYEPFAREMQLSEHEASGTGLGLVITKHLVEIMGGTISFESNLGEGTTYVVTLSFAVADESDCKACSSRDTDDGSLPLAGINVLLAEDNELNREIAEFVLAQAGATVVSAENGKEALELFEASPAGTFDVILMDIMMPVMGGYETARAIRTSQHGDAASIPIIAASANAFADDRRASHEAGMNEHIAKPIDSNELIAAIEALVLRKK